MFNDDNKKDIISKFLLAAVEILKPCVPYAVGGFFIGFVTSRGSILGASAAACAGAGTNLIIRLIKNLRTRDPS